jgi:hypothetical protein
MEGLSQQIAYISTVLAAIAALGTAAAGLVDVLKTLPDGGVSHIGFDAIRQALQPLAAAFEAIKLAKPWDTLHANWINGVPSSQQKAVAKSLIHLGLTPDNAAELAASLGIDPAALKQVADNIKAGTPLSQQNLNVLGRFDTMVGAILDAGYERAGQKYRNGAKLAAMVISVILAALAGLLTHFNVAEAALIGLVATPLAPVAKDLASSIQAAANAVSVIKAKPS